ncbi:hypothetical protein F5146DRAFT_1042498 [Armillaria mellea]|nr:hypothetical protein F5146DRAFT_1042498 [Armillaria mellea]
MTYAKLIFNWSIEYMCLYRFDIIVLVTRRSSLRVYKRSGPVQLYLVFPKMFFFKAGFSILLAFSTIAVAQDIDAVKSGGLGTQCGTITGTVSNTTRLA